MVILNSNDTKSRTITKEKYIESLKGFHKGHEVITGRTIDDLSSFTIEPETAMIIELN